MPISTDKNKKIEKLITLTEAASGTPYSQEYLSLLARRGKLFSKKVGRNWYTTKEAVAEYLTKQGLTILIPKGEADYFYQGKIKRPVIFNQASRIADLTAAAAAARPRVTPPVAEKKSEEAQKSRVIEEFEKLNPPGKIEIPKLISPTQVAREAQKQLPQTVPPISFRAESAVPGVEPKVGEALQQISKSLEVLTQLEKSHLEAEQQFERHPEPELSSEQKEFYEIASRSLVHRFRKLDVLANKLLQNPKTAMGILVSAIVLIFLFAGGFSFGEVDAIAQRVHQFFKDADTIQGHFAGTHANEVLLLDKVGNISIYGHIETQGQFRSFAPDGVAPIVVDSKTLVENLNANYLDGLASKDFTLAFVTKNGNITYDDVQLERNVEVGKTLTVKGATKLLDSLSVYGGLGVFSDAIFGKNVTLTSGNLKIEKGNAEISTGNLDITQGNLNLGQGTIGINNTSMVKNLNSEFLQGKRPTDFTLDYVIGNGNSTNQLAFFNGGIYGGNGSFKSLGVVGDTSIGSSDDKSKITVTIFSKKFTLDSSGNITNTGNLTTGGNTTTGGTTTTSSLVVSSTVQSNLIPSSSSFSLGSASSPWGHVYANIANIASVSVSTLAVTGSSSFAGTTSKSFVIDMGNKSSDAEDSYLAFHRGVVKPKATITWQSSQKRFNINEPLQVASKSFVAWGNVTLGSASSDALTFNTSTLALPNNLNVGSGTLFINTSNQKIGIGTTAPLTKLDIKGGTASMSALVVTGVANIGLGGVATVSYNRFGTGTTSHTNYINSANDLFVSGSLEVAASATFNGNLTAGSTVTNSLIVNSQIKSDLIPFTNAFKLGSTTNHWGNLFADSANINSLSVASTSIGGTNATDFTIGANNATNDAQNESVTFKRGSPTINAAMQWDSTNKRFNFNFPVFLQTVDLPEPNNNFTNLTLKGALNQVNKDYFDIQNSNGSKLLAVQTGGLLTASGSFQAGGGSTATVSYSRFGNLTTNHTNYISTPKDLFVSGNFDTKGSASFAGTASISNTLWVSPGGFSGNVGIGKTNPAALLDVNGSAIIRSNIQVLGAILGSGGGGTLALENTDVMTFLTNGYVEQMRITKAGNVGIGTSAPLTKFNVKGGTASVSAEIVTGVLNAGLGGVATVSYNRFGTSTTTHGLSASNDLLISGKLEVGGTAYFNGTVNFPSIASASLFYAQPGTASSPSFAFAKDQDTGIFNPSQETLGFSTFGLERLRIDSSGNVGVGTTVPTYHLQVESTANNQFQVTGKGTGYGGTLLANIYSERNTAGTDALLQVGSAFAPNTLYVQDSGNVGIGTTGPGVTLDVVGTIRTQGGSAGLIFMDRTSLQNWQWYGGSSSARLFNGSSDLVTVQSGGNVGIGTTSPGALLNVKRGTNADSTGQPSGTFASIIYNATNVSGENGLLIKNNWEAAASTPLEVGQDFVSGAYRSLFKIDGAGNVTMGTVAGNVGIGTTAPLTIFNVHPVANTNFILFGNSNLGSNTIEISNVNDANNTYEPMEFSAAKFNFANGNVGIGTTAPVAADGLAKTVQIGNKYILQNPQGNQVLLSNNAYFDGVSWKYATTDYATAIRMYNGEIDFHLAPSGTAGSNIPAWDTTARMLTILNGGNVGIGTTGPTTKLMVQGTAGPNDLFNVASASGTSILYVTKAGNVGIGTTSPDHKLSILTGASQSTTGILLQSSDNHNVQIRPSMGAGSNNGIVQAGDSGIIYDAGSINTGGFVIAPWNSGTNGIRLNNNGNVGIGASAPSAQLSIENDATNANATFSMQGQGAHLWNFKAESAANGNNFVIDTFATFYGNSGNISLASASGNVGIGTTVPNNKLDVWNNANSATYNEIVRFLVTNNAGGTNYSRLTIGQDTTNNIFLDAANQANTKGSLLLQPYGGNVGIGTTGPRQILAVGTTLNQIDFGGTANDKRVVLAYSSSQTTVGADDGIVIRNENTTTNNMEGLHFSTATGGTHSTITASIVAINGARTSDQYSSGSLAFLTSPGRNLQDTERMRIAGNGNVGIGTTAPNTKLHVYDTASSVYIKAETTQAAQQAALELKNGTSDWITYVPGSSSDLRFFNGADKITFQSGGNVGIGTTGPTTKLMVQGTAGPNDLFNVASASGTPILYVTKGGNVGIGTTVPAFKLDVTSSGADSYILARSYGGAVGFLSRAAGGTSSSPSAITSGSGIGFFGGTGYGSTGFAAVSRAWLAMYADETWTDTAQGTYMAFATTPDGTTSTTTRMIIKPTGRVGIGWNTNPDFLLTVASTGANAYVLSLNNGSGTCNHAPGASSETVTCSSDIKLKTNIQDYSGALDYLSGFRVRSFTLKADGSNKVGVIAQEVQQNHPELVNEVQPGILGVAEPNPWILVKSVQEQQGEIASVSARLASISAQFYSLPFKTGSGQGGTASVSLQYLSTSVSGSNVTITHAAGFDTLTLSAAKQIIFDVPVAIFNTIRASGDVIAHGIKKTYYSVADLFPNFDLATMAASWTTRSIEISQSADMQTVGLLGGNGAQAAEQSKVDLQDNGNYLATYGVDSTRGETQLSGSSKLVGGEAKVFFDFSFTSIISDKAPIRVIVTPTTDIRGELYVAQKTIYGFVVKELNGEHDGMFDWLVIARRKGYDSDITASASAGFSPTPSPSPQSMAPSATPVPSVSSTPEPTPASPSLGGPSPTPLVPPSPAPVTASPSAQAGSSSIPTPSPTPTPSPSNTPAPSPSPSQTPTPSPSPSSTPVPTPNTPALPTPTPSPSTTPIPAPNTSATSPTPTPTQSPSKTPIPSLSPTASTSTTPTP